MGQTYSNTSKRALFALYKYSYSKPYEGFGEVYTFISNVLRKEICLTVVENISIKLPSEILKLKRQFLLQEHENVLKLFDLFIMKKGQLGSMVQNPMIDGEDKCVCLLSENFKESLKDKIDRLAKEGKSFTENELWRLADNIIPALAHLQMNGIPLHKINEEMIFIKSDESYVISPVNAFLTEYNRTDKRLNPYKDDLFQFGHLLLYCSTLQLPVNIYSDIERIKDKFSDAWIDHLKNILTQDDKDRPDALTLYKEFVSLKQSQNSKQEQKPRRNVRTHLKGLQQSSGKVKRELSPFQVKILKTNVRKGQFQSLAHQLANPIRSRTPIHSFRSAVINNPQGNFSPFSQNRYQVCQQYQSQRARTPIQSQRQMQLSGFASNNWGSQVQYTPYYMSNSNYIQSQNQVRPEPLKIAKKIKKKKSTIKMRPPKQKSKKKLRQKKGKKQKVSKITSKKDQQQLSYTNYAIPQQHFRQNKFIPQTLVNQPQIAMNYQGSLPQQLPSQQVFQQQQQPYQMNYQSVMQKYLNIAKVKKISKKDKFSPLKQLYMRKKTLEEVEPKKEGKSQNFKLVEEKKEEPKVVVKKQEKFSVKVQNEIISSTLKQIKMDETPGLDRKFLMPVFKNPKSKFLLKPSLTRPIPSLSILSPTEKKDEGFFEQNNLQHIAKSQQNLHNEFQTNDFEYKNVRQVLNLLPIKPTDDDNPELSYNQQTVQLNYPQSENLEDQHYFSIDQQEHRANEVRKEVTKLISSQRKKRLDFTKEENSPYFKPELDKSDYVSEYDRVMDKYSKYISNKD